jgi:hypothetical protein
MRKWMFVGWGVQKPNGTTAHAMLGSESSAVYRSACVAIKGPYWMFRDREDGEGQCEKCVELSDQRGETHDQPATTGRGAAVLSARKD